MAEINCGYEIVARRVVDEEKGHYVVLGLNREYGFWCTWLLSLKPGKEPYYYYGHYFMEKEQNARNDFAYRRFV